MISGSSNRNKLSKQELVIHGPNEDPRQLEIPSNAANWPSGPAGSRSMRSAATSGSTSRQVGKSSVWDALESTSATQRHGDCYLG